MGGLTGFFLIWAVLLNWDMMNRCEIKCCEIKWSEANTRATRETTATTVNTKDHRISYAQETQIPIIYASECHIIDIHDDFSLN
jgi:hypothetical protein